MSILLTQELRDEYNSLYSTCAIKPNRLADVDSIIQRILPHQPEYQTVADATSVPWFVIAVIHSRESDLDFKTHLHNGDPLSARTTHVPRGRPAAGSPPFQWTASAIDAIRGDRLDVGMDGTVPDTLFRLEIFNGLGYRQHDINSPYLWSFSNNYSTGKFTADRHFSSTATDRQCGAATLLQRMNARGDISFMPSIRIQVTVNGQNELIPAMLLGDCVWVGVRSFLTRINETITNINNNPFSITVTVPGGPDQAVNAKLIGSTGFVKIRDLEPLYHLHLSFDEPNRTLAVTKA